jgi:M6 family metalloprotease-like protein
VVFLNQYFLGERTQEAAWTQAVTRLGTYKSTLHFNKRRPAMPTYGDLLPPSRPASLTFTHKSQAIWPKRLASLLTALVLALVLVGNAAAGDAHRDPKLGLVSDLARGAKRYLVILVNFPDVQPKIPLPTVEERALAQVSRWYQASSYGQTRFEGTVKGPYILPDPVERYKVSPYNYQVSSDRVYALVRDALSLAEEGGTPINAFDVVAVIHRCFTRPGQGYGMICYCANPGMLSKVSRGRAKYVTITTRRGTPFNKGVVVMAENFHLGFLVHDLAHAIAGVHDGVRLAGDLYDFDTQSRPRQQFQIHDAALYLGPWDLLSQHFLEMQQPPPGFSLFSKIRLGYVRPDQIEMVRPGETKAVRLSSLAAGGSLLGVKIPLSRERYLLVENRQAERIDRILPGSGVMIYRVNEGVEEGHGLVRAENADPSAVNFSRAPFGVENQARLAFIDQRDNVAVVPIAKQGSEYVVLVTTPTQAEAAASIARNLKGQGRGPGVARVLELLEQGRVPEALAASRR